LVLTYRNILNIKYYCSLQVKSSLFYRNIVQKESIIATFAQCAKENSERQFSHLVSHT